MAQPRVPGTFQPAEARWTGQDRGTLLLDTPQRSIVAALPLAPPEHGGQQDAPHPTPGALAQPAAQGPLTGRGQRGREEEGRAWVAGRNKPERTRQRGCRGGQLPAPGSPGPGPTHTQRPEQAPPLGHGLSWPLCERPHLILRQALPSPHRWTKGTGLERSNSQNTWR